MTGFFWCYPLDLWLTRKYTVLYGMIQIDYRKEMAAVSGKDITTYMNEIKHTMDYEGLPLTKQNESDIIDILSGKRTAKEVKDAIINRYGLNKAG